LGCEFETTAVVVKENELPTYTIASDKTGCLSELEAHNVVVQFTKGKYPVDFEIGGVSYKTDATGKISIIAANLTPAPNETGRTYTPDNIKDGNQCNGAPAASVTIKLVNPPGITKKLDNIDFCIDPAKTVDIKDRFTMVAPLKANESLKYTKMDGNGTLTGSVLSAMGAGTHKVKVEVEIDGAVPTGCPVSEIIEFTVFAKPTVEIKTQNVCFGSESALSVNQLTGAAIKAESATGAYTWDINKSGTLNSTTVAAPKITAVPQAGDYTVGVTVTDINGCVSDRVSAPVTIYEIPVATLSPDQKFCESDPAKTITATITPAALATGGTGSWTVATKDSETTATFDPKTATGT
jgi:hypothetical protein